MKLPMAAPPTESTPAAPSPQARARENVVAIAILTIVGAIFTWWGWKEGAYFGGVFFPGAITLYALLILLLIAAPFAGRFAGPARIALSALAVLAAWTLLSFAWTSSHDAAVQDSQRALLYAALFGLGLWTCNLAGRRLLLTLAPVATAGALVGIATTVTLATGTDLVSYVHADATLRFPIGYRNANPAFFLICLWPLIVLAAEGGLRWQLRALMIGGGTMLLGLATLSESRGSLPATAVALAVFLAFSPRRLRAAAYLALAAMPLLPALPTLLNPFQHGVGPGLLPLLHDAARAIAFSSLGSIVLAALCVRGVEMRLNLGRERTQLISRAVAAIAIAVVAVGGTLFVAKQGGPLKFVDQRVSEFNHGGDPDLQSQGTRFGVNIASDRRDLWRVALGEGGDHLLAGGGAGSFASEYLLHRNTGLTPKDPHSVEMLMLSELGIAGLLLFGTVLVATTASALRSRRLGPSAAALVAGSMGAGSYWLVHASYDWFWHYPALTAPVMFLLGVAAAPSLRAADAGRRTWRRWVGVAALSVGIVVAVPPFFSESYANRAYDEYPGDSGAALSDLNRAADLDPYDPEPLLAKGLIESRLGRDQAAISAFREAIDRQSDAYAAHFFLARALAPTDPAAARVEAREALRLNPLDLQTRALNRRLQRARRL